MDISEYRNIILKNETSSDETTPLPIEKVNNDSDDRKELDGLSLEPIYFSLKENVLNFFNLLAKKVGGKFFRLFLLIFVFISIAYSVHFFVHTSNNSPAIEYVNPEKNEIENKTSSPPADSASQWLTNASKIEMKQQIYFDDDPFNDLTYEIPKVYQGFWRIRSCDNTNLGYVLVYPKSITDIEVYPNKMSLRCFSGEYPSIFSGGIALGLFLKEPLFLGEEEKKFDWDKFSNLSNFAQLELIPNDSNHLLIRWVGFYDPEHDSNKVTYQHNEYPIWFNHFRVPDTLVRCDIPKILEEGNIKREI